MILMIIELLVVLLALYVGSRYGSLALGAISGIGLALLVFGFGMKPGSPPTDVIYIIIAAVTCAGIMQASGGMDWLIQIAEKMLRKHPDRITFLAPLCTFFLTVLVGTGHVVYTLMPIICDIAIKKGIRPERPCGVASIASQVGITCSPIAAAVVAFVTISNANGFDISLSSRRESRTQLSANTSMEVRPPRSTRKSLRAPRMPSSCSSVPSSSSCFSLSSRIFFLNIAL